MDIDVEDDNGLLENNRVKNLSGDFNIIEGLFKDLEFPGIGDDQAIGGSVSAGIRNNFPGAVTGKQSNNSGPGEEVSDQQLNLMEIGNLDNRMSFDTQSTQNLKTPFQCHFCDNVFYRVDLRRKHEEENHKEQLEQQQQQQQQHQQQQHQQVIDSPSEKDKTLTKGFKCQFCDKTFTRKCHLKSHEKKNHIELVEQQEEQELQNLQQQLKKQEEQEKQERKKQQQKLQARLNKKQPQGSQQQQNGDQQHQDKQPGHQQQGKQHQEREEQQQQCEQQDEQQQQHENHQQQQQQQQQQDQQHQEHQQQEQLKQNQQPSNNEMHVNSSPSNGQQGKPDATKGYTCETCGNAFLSKALLTAHLRSHLKAFKCSVCEKAFKRKDVLAKHEVLHSGERPFKCKDCDSSFKQKAHLDKHFRNIHLKITDDSLKCDICNRAFNLRSNLRRHQRVHSDEKPFKCNSCEKSYKDPFALKKHRLIHERNNGKPSQCSSHLNGLKQHQSTHDHNNGKPFQCSSCNKCFTHLNGLKQHQPTHDHNNGKPFQCSSCNKCFRHLNGLKQHHASHCHQQKQKRENQGKQCNTKPFICNVCGKVFTRKDGLARHEFGHLGERPFKCTLCDSAFKQKPHLKKHVVNVHHKVKDESLKCTICDRAFTTWSNLHQHQRIHTEEKPFKCNFCDKSFKRLNSLRTHQTIHLFQCNLCNNFFNDFNQLRQHQALECEEKPFECSVCKTCFDTKTELEDHVTTHPNEKPFKCTYCDKAFASKTRLKVHTRTHTGEKPFKCTLCDKSFKFAGSLSEHKLVHADIRKYKCTHCDRTFVNKGNCLVHERIHSNDKPFKCQYCNKAFKHSNSLKRHHPHHVCETCGKVFKHVEYAKLHKRIHDMRRMYKCYTCATFFMHKNARRQHIEAHSKEIITCTICKQTFNRRILHKDSTKTREKQDKCLVCLTMLENRATCSVCKQTFQKGSQADGSVNRDKCSACLQKLRNNSRSACTSCKKTFKKRNQHVNKCTVCLVASRRRIDNPMDSINDATFPEPMDNTDEGGFFQGDVTDLDYEPGHCIMRLSDSRIRTEQSNVPTLIYVTRPVDPPRVVVINSDRPLRELQVQLMDCNRTREVCNQRDENKEVNDSDEHGATCSNLDNGEGVGHGTKDNQVTSCSQQFDNPVAFDGVVIKQEPLEEEEQNNQTQPIQKASKNYRQLNDVTTCSMMIKQEPLEEPTHNSVEDARQLPLNEGPGLSQVSSAQQDHLANRSSLSREEFMVDAVIQEHNGNELEPDPQACGLAADDVDSDQENDILNDDDDDDVDDGDDDGDDNIGGDGNNGGGGGGASGGCDGDGGDASIDNGDGEGRGISGTGCDVDAGGIARDGIVDDDGSARDGIVDDDGSARDDIVDDVGSARDDIVDDVGIDGINSDDDDVQEIVLVRDDVPVVDISDESDPEYDEQEHQQEPKPSQNTPEKKPLQCVSCNKVCYINETSSIYRPVLNGERPFVCIVCNFKTFKQRHDVVYSTSNKNPHHVSAQGDNNMDDAAVSDRPSNSESGQRCDFCLKDFNTERGLQSHLRQVHGSSKPFMCCICWKQCTTENSLKSHFSQKHSRRGPHRCKVCSQEFMDWGHQQQHHFQVYECEVCHKIFNWKKHLIRHKAVVHLVNISSNSNISIPDQGFVTLKNHVNRNQDQRKPFKCSLCDEKFTCERNLRDHELKHRPAEKNCHKPGEQCSVCETINRLKNLNRK